MITVGSRVRTDCGDYAGEVLDMWDNMVWTTTGRYHVTKLRLVK